MSCVWCIYTAYIQDNKDCGHTHRAQSHFYPSLSSIFLLLSLRVWITFSSDLALLLYLFSLLYYLLSLLSSLSLLFLVFSLLPLLSLSLSLQFSVFHILSFSFFHVSSIFFFYIPSSIYCLLSCLFFLTFSPFFLSSYPSF